VIRYLYARALYLKDEKEADKNLQVFASLQKDYPFQGEYQSEKEFMERAEAKLQKAKSRKRSTKRTDDTIDM
ncbi:MAG: hypothetical protein IKS69_01000, partial [Erysipelotrichaceae bacterium]|nr:hypothetical protein [Erysipelotrichaceae bacterium]